MYYRICHDEKKINVKEKEYIKGKRLIFLNIGRKGEFSRQKECGASGANINVFWEIKTSFFDEEEAGAGYEAFELKQGIYFLVPKKTFFPSRATSFFDSYHVLFAP